LQDVVANANLTFAPAPNATVGVFASASFKGKTFNGRVPQFEFAGVGPFLRLLFLDVALFHVAKIVCG